jgi:hypothetical protein
MISLQVLVEKVTIQGLCAGGWIHSCAASLLGNIAENPSIHIINVYTMIYHICCLRKSVAQDCDTEILKLMRFTISRVNLVFDVLYECGIFIPRAESIKAVEAGFDACAICLQQLRYEFICLCIISAG